MRVHDLTSAAAVLDDMIVYRNLVPMDDRLPGLREIAPRIGIEAQPAGSRRIPRKSEPDYARVMVELLRAARALDAPHTPLQRLIFIGDTRMNDGTAFANLCRAGGWPGMAFIGSETGAPARADVIVEGEQAMFLANRWEMLSDFDRACRDRGFAVDAATAVILDLDKTTLGARGRNDRVIDEARVAAVRETVVSLLGSDFGGTHFEANYDLFNQSEFHPFTTDNQDYLAYLCLMLGSALAATDRRFNAPALAQTIRNGELTRFVDFLAQVEAHAAALPDRLRELHDEIYRRVMDGDPTPFKAFRRNEYLMTVRRMGHLPSGTSVTRMLAEEIVITQEVRYFGLDWRSRGALLFGLSDKPDEASIPTEAGARAGLAPLHRTQTHAVGAARLNAHTSSGGWRR
jgi:hypothetical protein